MTNTKSLRWALLGGAALGVMASGAQADELSALKAQLESLQSRVSQLESQPMPALPPGTRLLTVRKGLGSYSEILPMRASEQLRDFQGYTIAVTPTADMPAPVSEVTVSGEIRARLLYETNDTHDGHNTAEPGPWNNGIDTSFDSISDDPIDHDWNILTRGRLRVDGKTQTAIGEVGGTIRLQAENQTSANFAKMNIIWGYWQMTPNLQLGGGFTDSLSAVLAGPDWNGNTVLDGFNAGPSDSSVSQFRLTYTSGGLTLAASLEDNPVGTTPAVAGLVTFDTGTFLLNVDGLWRKDESEPTPNSNSKDDWVVGGGVVAHLGDMFRVEAAANTGQGYVESIYPFAQKPNENDMKFWSASALAVLKFSDNMSLELDFGYSNLKHEDRECAGCEDVLDNAVTKLWSAGAEIFWDPVDQLTLGWGVGWNKQETESENGANLRNITAGFGAWFRF